MFKELNNGFYSNRNEEFLENSDLVIFWNEKPFGNSKKVSFRKRCDECEVKINSTSDKLALLLSRLAFVFDVIDESAKTLEDYSDFVDFIRGVRIKATLENVGSSLEEFSAILHLINESKSVSIVIDEDDEEIVRHLISFGALIGLFSEKVGVYLKSSSFIDDYNDFRFFE
jgi:hypothetical protein